MRSNSTTNPDISVELKPPVLDRRLSMVSSLVPDQCIPADIGTDHAYLPCYLVMTGRVQNAFASDVAEGPLRNAVSTVARFGLEDRIKCILSDGTKQLPCAEYDTLIIAGMGGELIRDILRNTENLKHYKLILQPMTHAEDLRCFLCGKGFQISDERACLDKNKIYISFSAEHTGNMIYSDDIFYHYFGGYYAKKDPASKQYVSKQLRLIRSRISGLQSSSAPDNSEIESLLTVINDERLVNLS